MKIKAIGFNKGSFEKLCLEDYKENYVLFGLRNNKNLLGNLFDLNSQNIFLLPYQKPLYKKNSPTKFILEKKGLPYILKRTEIIDYQTLTLEEVNNFIDYLNKESDLEFLRKRKEIFELKKYNKKLK